MAEIVSFPAPRRVPARSALDDFLADPLGVAMEAASVGIDQLEEIIADQWDGKDPDALAIIAGEAMTKIARRDGYADAMALAETFSRIASPPTDGEAA